MKTEIRNVLVQAPVLTNLGNKKQIISPDFIFLPKKMELCTLSLTCLSNSSSGERKQTNKQNQNHLLCNDFVAALQHPRFKKKKKKSDVNLQRLSSLVKRCK